MVRATRRASAGSGGWPGRLAFRAEAVASLSQSPASTLIWLPQRRLAEGRPRRVSAPSITSSWINVALWIAVVIVLEVQIRFPAAAANHRAVYVAVACMLYAGLGVLAAIWMWRGEWFDAYDALLWLAALIVIEMNILQKTGRRGS